jgi:hypothetical protein
MIILFMWNSDVEARESIIYSYTKIFNAFAAKLSKAEASKLSRMCTTPLVYVSFVQLWIPVWNFDPIYCWWLGVNVQAGKKFFPCFQIGTTNSTQLSRGILSGFLTQQKETWKWRET